MSQQVFDRYEKKYMLTPAQYEFLRERLTPYFAEDGYGLHTICSVYYDTEDFAVTRLSADKPVYKEKLRLRSYGVPGGPAPKPDSDVFLELKKKYKGIVNKRRISLTLGEARDYLKKGAPPSREVAGSQVFKEIDWFVKRWRPDKGVLVAYDRIALAGLTEGAPRMTFDWNVRWRTERPDPGFGTEGEPLLAGGRADSVLMEVKIPGAMPLWLADLLDEAKVFPASFSKIGSIYSVYLNPFTIKNRRNVPCLKASCPSRQTAVLQSPAPWSAPPSR